MRRDFPPLVLFHGWYPVQTNAGAAIRERQREPRPFGSKWLPDELHLVSPRGKTAEHGLGPDEHSLANGQRREFVSVWGEAV